MDYYAHTASKLALQLYSLVSSCLKFNNVVLPLWTRKTGFRTNTFWKNGIKVSISVTPKCHTSLTIHLEMKCFILVLNATRVFIPDIVVLCQSYCAYKYYIVTLLNRFLQSTRRYTLPLMFMYNKSVHDDDCLASHSATSPKGSYPLTVGREWWLTMSGSNNNNSTNLVL